jgi:signal transduction histidine kinase
MILAPVERILNLEAGTMSPEALTKLETVRINGHRLLKLINQLLDFAKLEAGHTQLRLSAVDVNALVTELAQAMRPLAEQRELALVLDLDRAIPDFGADQEKLDTVITNLLSNALKFTPPGGEIRIQTQLHDGQVRVAVIDNGVGIAPQDQERIFERFFQVDGSSSREKPGTGLGMALSKELIALHGGTITLESELGKGSCFSILVPLAKVPLTVEPSSPSADAKPTLENVVAGNPADASKRQYQRFAEHMACSVEGPKSNAAKVLAPGTPRVLVVDDTAEVRAAVTELLEDHYVVLQAQDGGEGYEVARREQPDLIISDLMMPKVDGYEFCRLAKEDPQTAQIPFVMLTAKADRSMKVAGLDHGADEYLAKPFDAKEMLARVRSMLRLRQMHKVLDKRNCELQSTLSELRTTQAQLVQSEKMSSLGQLVAGLAHEINNSINAVYNGIQPLRTKSQKLEQLVAGAIAGNPSTTDATGKEISKHFAKISQLAEIIEHGASRTAQIVQDLKTFSHPGRESAETFNVHAALDVCLSLLASRTKQRISVHRDFQADGLIQGASGQINQVFMNLLSNAQDAIQGEGQITVSTRDCDDRVIVSVKDTGEGIPPHIQSKIFDPFFTTKPVGKGTGLGLSISYSLVNRLGGSIQFQTSPETGTEFIVSLPRCMDLRDAGGPEVEALATAFG